MIWCKCIGKIRDKNNIITDYEIVSLAGEKRVVSKEQLKMAIANNQVALVNMKIAKDGKLMDRAAEEEAQLTKKLTLGNASKEDSEKLTNRNERIALKANMIGTAVGVDNEGVVISVPNTDTVVITPNVKMIGPKISYNDFEDKTVIFTGNEDIGYGLRVYFDCANTVVIQNPALLAHVNENLLRPKKIVLDFDNIDVKTLDIIFKTYKTDMCTYSQRGFTNIIIKQNRLNKDEAVDRVRKILLRQKPSSIVARRAYDLVVYLRLLRTLNSSYNEILLSEMTKQYLDELRDKLELTLKGFGGNSGTFERYLRSSLEAITKLCEELKGTL